GGIRMDVAGATVDLAGFDNSVTYLHEPSGAANAADRDIQLGGATLTISAGSNGSFSGAISGPGNLVKNGNGAQTLGGCESSYSGTTTINGGTLHVACLRDGGTVSSIGSSGAAPSNLVLNGGSLSYVGAGGSTDRQFTLGTAGGTLAASGSGAIVYTSTAPITLDGTTARTITLRGTSTHDNTLAAEIADGSAGATSLSKADAGTWV